MNDFVCLIVDVHVYYLCRTQSVCTNACGALLLDICLARRVALCIIRIILLVDSCLIHDLMFACDNCLWNDFGLSANGSEVLKMLKIWFCYARNRVVPGGNRFPLNPKLLILWFLVPGTVLSLGGDRFLRCFCPCVCVPGTGLSLGENRFPVT